MPVTGSPSPRRAGEESLRGIAGTGSSRVGVQGALRARDVSRPDPAQLAVAERADRPAQPTGKASSASGPDAPGRGGSSPVAS